MVGRALREILPEAVYLSSQDADLSNPDEASKVFEDIRPSHVIHLAASLGGMAAIFTMESTKRELIPDWEKSLPQEAQTPAPAD